MEFALLNKLFISLFAMTNPIGNMGIFCGLVGNQSGKKVRQIAMKVAISSFFILIVAAMVGKDILTGFGISIPAFSVAGGLIVLMIALSMLHGSANSSPGEHADDDIAIVPMSIPMVAGPGALVAVILFTHKHPLTVDNTLPVFLVFFAIAILVGLIFSLAPLLIKALKEKGIRVVTKIMGLLLSGIAMEMIIEGLKEAKLFIA